jgi:hypothetical protein
MEPSGVRRERLQAGLGLMSSRAVLAVVAACILAAGVSSGYATADDSLPVLGSDAGATDPVGAADTNMFRDDELNLWGATRNSSTARFYPGAPTSDDLMGWDFNFGADAISWGPTFGITWAFKGGSVYGSDGKPDYAWPLMAMAPGRVTDLLHDEVVIAGTDGSPGTVDVQVRSANDAAIARQTQLTTEPHPDSTVGVDAAVGDLDRVVDDNGEFHDEIVVVWGPQGADCRARIDVLDYQNLHTLASTTIGGCTGRVAATIGDFNGDGNLEFAAVTNDEMNLRAKVCSLIADAPGQWHLECFDEITVANPEKFPSMDAAAGKVFLGYGQEFLIIVTSPGAASSTDYFRMTIVGVDEEVAPPSLALWQTFQSTNPEIGGNKYSIPGVHEVRVATGLFRYDPATGYDFADRQIVTAALGVVSGSQTAALWFWDMNDPTHTYPQVVFATAQTSTSGRHTAKPSLAVGNFVGHGVNGDQDSPTMQAGLTYLVTASDNLTDGTKVTQQSWIWSLVPPDIGSPNWGTLRAWDKSFATNHGFDGYDPFMITEDYDGDSWRLGIPIHIMINDATSFNSVLEEPPKHVDYLPVDPDDLSKGFGVVNISGYRGFKVQLKESAQQTIKTGVTDTTDWSVSGGADLSYDWQRNFGGFYGRNNPFNDPKVRLDVHDEFKADGHYQDTTKDINAAYKQATVTWTNSTDTDDELDVSIQDTDIWRYPIYGFETGDPSNPMGYYEIAIPGRSFSQQSAGSQFDWYAPLHVNGNILSYPQNLSRRLPWVPADVGSFEVPQLECPPTKPGCADDQKVPVVDEDTGKPVMLTKTALMNDQTMYTWDGNEHTQEIQFNETSEASHDKQFDKGFSASNDIGIGISGSTQVPVPGTDAKKKREFKADLTAAGGASWGGDTVGSMQLSGSKGLTFTIPPISSFSHEGRSYSFTTAVYASADGGELKVAHTILDLISAPEDWWVKQYGRAPDPALNLPFRFREMPPDPAHANLDWWELRTQEDDPDDIRHRMRGFFMRNNYTDKATGDYELISHNPVDGDTIRLCARVHNFSLGRATGNFEANFYYRAWDNGSAAYAGELVPIGTATVENLDSLSTADGITMREVCVPWDTTGLSQVSDHEACVGSPLHCAVTTEQSCTTSADCPLTDIGYRFWVKLDEKDDVKGEIHELKDAKGREVPASNNSGYWPWKQAVPVLPPEEEASSAAGTLDTGLDLNFWLSEGDIAIKAVTGFLEGGAVELTAGETYGLRAHMVSENSYSGNVWVAFFDGKPREGGKLIALEVAHGVRKGDNYAWADWAPQTPGEHELRAYAFHRVSVANRVGGTTSRLVTVVEAETPTPTPTPTPLPTSTPAAGWREGGDGCSLSSGGGGSEVSGPATLVLLGIFWLAVRGFTRRPARRTRGQR